MRFANDADELSDRVRVRRLLAPLAPFRRDAVSLLVKAPSRAPWVSGVGASIERLKQAA